MASATVPLYADDDFERLADLRTALSIAQGRLMKARVDAEESTGSNQRAGDNDSDAVQDAKEAVDVVQEAFNDFVDAAAERAEMWTLKPIGHEEFRALVLAHPPRKIFEGEGVDRKEVTHPDDASPWDVNTETFPKALLLFVDPDDDEHRTIVAPKFDTEAAMRKRVKRLSEGEFESMWTVAYMTNKGGVADPKLSKR